MALDLGTRRTGLAITDTAQRVAFLRPELEHMNSEILKKLLESFIKDEEVKGLLIGYPTKLSGETTEQTQKVEDTVRLLKTLGLPIHLMDERLSTRAADNPNRSDSRAAQILLEIYLSSKT